MVAPRIYHPLRKSLLQHIVVSSIVGFALSEWFWHGYVIPKVQRRNFVMSLIEEERKLKKESLAEAFAEFPAQGSYEDLVGPLDDDEDDE
ncbi:hypothetical protein MIR68_008888 [Amoeboaphelidium protococcarum]|nr:hypothetical protein MIR68_012065 [Amoeboaphelidium protococcarum]KAI3632813.1 hypothetical protein MIR68_008888 [Amoeboaphelidium protococcarum]KAI3648256.1 hypothetical protein MP228_006110 [Amoeboaphelidium protococcarum]KAI3649650.1 hypothetical protein MP228_005282 [Amoeboaphelidium protococcarum]